MIRKDRNTLKSINNEEKCYLLIFYNSLLLNRTFESFKNINKNLADVVSQESVVLASQISEKEREKCRKGLIGKYCIFLLGAQKDHFIEMVHLSTHIIYFGWKIICKTLK